MTCPHRVAERCSLMEGRTSTLGVPIPCRADALNACGEAEPAFAENHVSLSVGMMGLRQAGIATTHPVFQSLLEAHTKCVQPRRPKICGPGCQLHRILLSFGVPPRDECDCTDHAHEMDRRGPQWCREHLDEILGWLIEELKGRLAEEQQRRQQPTENAEETGPTIPWWVRWGHRLPGASHLAGKQLILLAIDRAEQELAAGAH